MFRLALVLISLFAAACSRDAADYIARGNTFANASDYVQASLNYRKALQRSPDSGEAYYRLGLTEIKSGQAAAAFTSLRQAVRLMPDHEDAKVAMADLCLTSYAATAERPRVLYDQAANLTEAILLRSPDSVNGLRLKGGIALLDKRIDDALDILQKAQSLAPDNGRVAALLMEALFQKGQFDDAEKLGRRIIQTDSAFGPAYDTLAARLVNTGRRAEAESVLRSGVANNPKDPERYLMLAAFYHSAGDHDSMHRTIQELIRLNRPNLNVQTGDFFANRALWDEARRLYDLGANNEPKQRLNYLFRILRTHVAQQNETAISSTVAAILAEDPRHLGARLVRASQLIQSSNAQDRQTALEEADQLAKEHSDNAEVLELLGRAHVLRGNLDAAITSFRNSISASVNSDSANLRPRLEIAQIFLVRNRPDQALRYTDEILKSQPTHREARLLRAAALAQGGQPNQARSELLKLLEANPDDRQAKLQLAVVHIRAKRFAEADAILNPLYRLDAGDTRPLMALVNSRIAQSQTGVAIELLEKEVAARPNLAVIRRLLADTALAAGKPDLAIPHYNYLTEAVRNDPGLYARLGMAYQTKGDNAKAIKFFRSANRLKPDNSDICVLLASALKQTGQFEEAKTHYRRALSLQPDHLWALNNFAYLLAETGTELDTALAAAQKAVRSAPDQPAVQDTLGWVFFKKQQPEQAEKIFARLVTIHPEIATFRYHFGMVLLNKGDRSRARKELEAALARKPAPHEENSIREALSSL